MQYLIEYGELKRIEKIQHKNNKATGIVEFICNQPNGTLRSKI